MHTAMLVHCSQPSRGAILFRFESDFLASAGSAPSAMLIRSIGMMC